MTFLLRYPCKDLEILDERTSDRIDICYFILKLIGWRDAESSYVQSDFGLAAINIDK